MVTKTMRPFDLKTTIKRINLHMKKAYEMDTEDIRHKPDYYNLLTGEYECGKCGERYRLFHFFHKTDKQVCNDDCRYTDGICDRHGMG